jgi:hypothetical protein
LRSFEMALAALALALLCACAAAQAPGTPHGGAACATAFDCALGGTCTDSVCVCDAWFTGSNCTLLNLQRPRFGRESGTCGAAFNSYYSWGGRALYDLPSDTYHLMASFMCRHASLAQWTTVSSSAHFTSAVVDGPYEWFEQDCDASGICTPIVIPWSHNTVVAANAPGRSPAFLVAHIGDGVVPPAQWLPCFNKSDVKLAPPPRGARAPPLRASPGDTCYYTVADDLAGPWTRALNNSGVTINITGSWTTSGLVGNPAPLVNADGSVNLYFTATPCPAGHGALNANCIAMARAPSWDGVYQMDAAPRPITYPESEDPFVWRDFRGMYHLFTNVNTCHSRCAEGVPCGGHAWSADGVTFSDLYVGAFGPVITWPNGSEWRNAYVERPLVTMAPDGVTPLAFHVGMGRSSYEDSCNWVQLFCTNASDPSCGPTRFGPPPPAVRLRNGDACLLVYNASHFPCSGSGAAAGCPVVMGSCADPAAAWRADDLLAPGGGAVVSAAVGGGGVALDVDCNSPAPHTIVKALASGAASVALVGGRLAVEGGAACLNTGQGPARAPCGPAGEIFLDSQIQLAPCDDPAAQGWAVEQIAGL